MPSGRAGGPRPFAETEVLVTVKVQFSELRFMGYEELAVESALRAADNDGRFQTPVDLRGQTVTVEEKLSKRGEMEGGKLQGIDVTIWTGTPVLIRDDIDTILDVVGSVVDDAESMTATVSFSKIAGPGGVTRPFATTGFILLLELSDKFYEAIPSIPTLEADVRDQTGVRTLDITTGEGADKYTSNESSDSDTLLVVNPDARSSTIDYFDRIVNSIDQNISRASVTGYMMLLNGNTISGFL